MDTSGFVLFLISVLYKLCIGLPFLFIHSLTQTLKYNLFPICLLTLCILSQIFFVMESSKMHRQVALMRQSLFDQGFLDEQFIQLEELRDDANPNFVEEVVTLYYRDSARLIHNIEQALERSPLDFNRLDSNMHQFKGSSSSIGAKKVKSECTNFREYCLAGNGEGCMRSFQQLKKEYATLRKKLETYFQLARQAGPKDVACRRK